MEELENIILLWVVFPSISAPHFVSVSPLMGILIPLLRRIEISILWTSFFLSFITPPVLVVLQAGATTLKISLAAPQKIGHSTSEDPALISECIPCVFFCDWVTSLRMIFSSSSIYLRIS